MMRIQSRLCFSLVAAAALVLGAGCGGPKSQDKVDRETAQKKAEAAQDMAETRHDAQKDMADARQDAAEDRQEANEDITKANNEVAKADADATYKVAMEQAKDDHDVAVKKCDALPSDQRKACTDQANADLKNAQARADATRQQSEPD